MEQKVDKLIYVSVFCIHNFDWECVHSFTAGVVCEFPILATPTCTNKLHSIFFGKLEILVGLVGVRTV